MGGRRVGESWVLAALAAVAFLVRLLPLSSPGALTESAEYDGGAMFAGALRLLNGEWPYADFISVHPPGSLILFAPFSLVAGWAGEPAAMACLRLSSVLVGTLNTVLIGLLLRRYGMPAMVTGAGIYAVWPTTAVTERMIMLEPILNLCLLLALCAVRSRAGAGPWLAGIALGIALGVKYWAVFDVVLIGIVMFSRRGLPCLVRYLIAGAVTVGVLVLPFFIVAPDAMWQQTVVTQLSRSDSSLPMVERINLMSALWATPDLDRLIPWVVWAGALGFALVIAGVPIVGAMRSGVSPRQWTDPVWWGIVAVSHTAVMAASTVISYHYVAWVICPLALTTGAAMRHFRQARRRRVATVVAASTLALVGLPQLLTAPSSTTEHGPLRTWAADQDCIWADSAWLLIADAMRRNIDDDCDVDPDVFGAGLVLGTARDDRITTQLESVDAVMYPVDPLYRYHGERVDTALEQSFVLVGESGGTGMWERKQR